MFLIAEISDKDLGMSDSKKDIKYSIKKASRWIILNKDNKIPVLYVSYENYYKLPWWSLEENESLIHIYENL